jgi:hypothetical protein
MNIDECGFYRFVGAEVTEALNRCELRVLCFERRQIE